MKHLSGKAVIAGYGDTYSPGNEPRPPMAMAIDAALSCMKDAGVRRDEVDGLLTGRDPFGDYRAQWNINLASHLKITPRFTTQVTLHSAGVNAMLKHAILAVTSGAVENVLCVQSDGGLAYADLDAITSLLAAQPEFELPYGPSLPGLFGMVCRRYMHEYGVSQKDVAAAVVAHQEWGRLHPHAQGHAQGEITIDDVLRSPEVASPLRGWMCAPWRRTGTAGAFLVTSAARAADLDCTPISILGVGETSAGEYLIDRMSFKGGPHQRFGIQSSMTATAATISAQDAYEMAGLTPSDMQIANSTSNFAHVSMMMLEDLGFCDKGEAPNFISDGYTTPGGLLPYNTNGGMLAFGQSGVSGAIDGMVELVRQLRGEALGLQVDCQVGVAHAVGGPLTCHSTVILGGIGR